jgi:hypothetical protein
VLAKVKGLIAVFITLVTPRAMFMSGGLVRKTCHNETDNIHLEAKRRLMMDTYTIQHLDNWLNEQFHDEAERDAKHGKILVFVTEYPDLLERMSWWEILDLAESQVTR